MKVLAVGAHPDDLEILCGGTLARFAQDGHEVVMCHVSRGDRGSFVHTSEEISRIRSEEAGRSLPMGPSGAGEETPAARSATDKAPRSLICQPQRLEQMS